MRSISALVVMLLLTPVVGAEPDDSTASSNDQAADIQEPPLVLTPENQSVDGLEIEVRPDGILKVDLLGRFQHALAVRIEPDGSSVVECIDDAESMAAFLAAPAEELVRREETAEK